MVVIHNKMTETEKYCAQLDNCGVKAKKTYLYGDTSFIKGPNNSVIIVYLLDRFEYDRTILFVQEVPEDYLIQ